MDMGNAFDRFSRWANQTLGTPYVFAFALFLVILWGLSGPLFHFSNTWQLIANTATTLVTFLLGFLILHGQNLDHKEEMKILHNLIAQIHLKVHQKSTTPPLREGLKGVAHAKCETES